MLDKNLKNTLKKQHYAIAGRHSAVQICRWVKKSLHDEGFCHKQKFYGIKSHACCQMSPFVMCQNLCMHCWRPIQLTAKAETNIKSMDEPKKIIDECIKAQRMLISGFKGDEKTNMKKFREAQEPSQFAISLIGEPTMYPQLAELIKELKKRGKTSFLVTNGLCPERLQELKKKKALPTQLYISLNAPNKKIYEKWHKSRLKDAWKRFNKSLKIMRNIGTRTAIRITLVRDFNMQDEHLEDYAKLIKKAMPDFIEVKGYISVGYARQRLGYDKMPFHSEIKKFAKKMLKCLKNEKYKFLDEKKESCVILLGRSRKGMRIHDSPT